MKLTKEQKDRLKVLRALLRSADGEERREIFDEIDEILSTLED